MNSSKQEQIAVNKEESEYYKQGHALYKKVYAQLKDCYQDLAKL